MRVKRWVSAPIAVFGAIELGALVLWMILGRRQWFYLDEWDFLAGRKAGNVGDLFRPHNEHWTTLPILAHRALYSLFGLNTDFPYRLLVVLLHLVAAALLLVVIRGAGVRPWIATAAASLFVLFGAGWQNIVEPFQITFTGAVVFGLTHLLLVDHEGPLDRRDWLGLLAGLAGLMTSGVAVGFVLIVGLAVLVRRGWAPALFHTVPLGAAYVVWYVAIGHEGYDGSRGSPADVARFVWAGLRATYSAIGQLPGAGFVVAAVLVVGGALALRERAGHLRDLALPGALLVGSVLTLAIMGTGRVSFGIDFAAAPRYRYLVAAMTLPALAVAADAFVTRWRPLLVVAIAFFVVGIPGNVRALSDGVDALTKIQQPFKQMMLALPRDPLARTAPRALHPENGTAPQVTIGWLRDGVRQGRLPPPTRITAQTAATVRFRLSFFQSRGKAPAAPCRTFVQPVTVALRAGDVLGVYRRPLSIIPATGPPLIGPPVVVNPPDGKALIVLEAVGPVRIGPAPFLPPTVCGPGVRRVGPTP
jgi:hypothetical protein